MRLCALLLLSLTVPAVAAAPLPAPARTKVAREVRAADPRIEAARQRYLAKQRAGDLARPNAKKQANDARLHAAALDARAAYESSGDRRGKLIILEGLDLAGKSSLAELIEGAFKGLKVRVVHWGAPGVQKTALWQDAYLAELPKQGEIVVWDRSYMGRLIYDRYYKMIDDKTVDRRIDEVNGLEAMMKNQVDVTKLFYDTPGREMARRIGKREAIDHDKLDPKSGDYVAFRDRKQIRKRADYAVERTGKAIEWNTLDMSEPYDGKLQALSILAKRWSKAN